MSNPIVAPPAPPLAEPAKQETVVSRMTKGGRKLWYKLKVVQEAERARACGSGPKSTTDRRPVDPPPIVSLHVYEGESIENGTDVTFTYDANFFVFVTLEHARPMAHGRVNTPAATSPPVLTGFPVSGCAYLDRPEPAGYFLFPDLSVRHEGRYKFIFSLYEQAKDDQDRNPGDNSEESFDHRLQVESSAFNGFSAKKFPGLSESTSLSRTISEQGCRVRIRRDVRMRRRDNKPAATNDYEVQQKEEYERRQRTQTPELKPDPYRARSLSNSSMDRAPYDPYRRPSMSEYAPPPPPSYGPAPSTPTSAGGHLQFGQAAPQYSLPPHYGPGPTQQRHSSPVHPQQYPPPPVRSLNQPQPPSPYPPPHQAVHPPAPPTPTATQQYPTDRPPSRAHQYPAPPADTKDHRRTSVGTSSRPSPYSIESLCSQDPPIQAAAPSSAAPRTPQPLLPASRKRVHADCFPSDGYQQRLANGSRPMDPHMHPPALPMPGFDEPLDNRSNLHYRRACGDISSKPAPPTAD